MHRHSTNRRHAKRSRAGSVTVEFAFVCSILFMLFFGLIEVARFHVVRHTLDQAAYEGARAGIIVGSNAAAAEARARSVLQSCGIVNPVISITPNVITDATLAVTVTVSANYSQNSWCAPRYFANMNMVAATTLDHENVASQ